MKKSISLVLLAVFVSSSVAPAIAQKKTAAGLKETQELKVSTSTRFANVGAYTDGTGVYLAWRMEAEVGNTGFHVYRVSKTGVEMLSPEKLVAGAAMRVRDLPLYGQTYDFYDATGDGDAAYYIEAISLDGPRIRTREIYPAFTSDLRVVSGRTSAELAATVPKRARFEKSIPMYTKEIVNEMGESRLAPDPVTHRSVISQTGVIRIGVKNEGLYRVPRAQLEAAGFNVNSDSSMWQLYVEGVEQAIIIGNNADYIEFYGKGTNTPETDIRQYYLMSGTSPGKRMATRVAHRNTSTVVTPSYLQTFVKEENTNYLDTVDNGPLENYFGRGFGGTQTTMTFNLSGVDFATPTSALHLRFQGWSTGTHLVEVILNENVLAPVSGPAGKASFTGDIPIPTSFLLEGANSIKFRAIASASDFVFFDTMSISFSRKFLADQNKLSFYTHNYRIAKVDGFSTANVRVFDLTYDASPTLMTNLTFQHDGATFGANMPAARGRAFYAVEDSAILAPHSVTPNNPELVGIPTNSADLVIISYKDFLPEAKVWADYRRGRGQGFTVKVIEVSELYDEFSYGELSSAALSSFFDYAHANWQNPPQYALLIGDGSVDSRNYEGLGYWNLVPSRMVSAVYSETASDEALADFDDDGLAEIPIGRIATRTSAGVTTVFNKVVHWETRVSPLNRGALFAFDHNVGYDFDGMSLRVRNQLPAEVPATMVYRGEANANANLVAAMNTGKYIVNYAGHGTTGSWGGTPVFFNVFTVPTLEEDPDNPAIFTMLTCLNGAYHYLHNESFAEVLTKSPNRGAVAAWASTGLTLPNIQERMATRFYLKIGEGNIPRLGDLIRDAKSVLTLDDGGADVRRSWSLIGDPMLKVR